MHELSLSSAVLDTALRHADGRKVNQVDLTVGALRQVVPASLEFYWGIVTRDTDCEGATLAMTHVEALLACGACAAAGVDAGPARLPLPRLWRLGREGAGRRGVPRGVDRRGREEAACIAPR